MVRTNGLLLLSSESPTDYVPEQLRFPGVLEALPAARPRAPDGSNCSSAIAKYQFAMEAGAGQEMAMVSPRHHTPRADGVLEIRVDVSRAPSSSTSAVEGVGFSEDPEDASSIGVRGMTVAFKVCSLAMSISNLQDGVNLGRANDGVCSISERKYCPP
jgi:hypothetical protein